MADKKKSSKKGKNSKGFLDSFKLNMTPEGKSLMLRCMGVVIFLFAIFSFVSSVSYMFTWKQDQSLVAQSGVSGDDVANLGGSMGLKWGSFLVADFLGLGSFAFIFLLGLYAIRLFFWKMDIGVLRVTFITVSGGFICSLLLSLFGSGEAFGGGLGGYAGFAVVDMLSGFVGKFVTVLMVLAIAVVWLLCVNGRFAHWFAVAGENVGVKTPKDETEVASDDEDEDEEDEEGEEEEENEVEEEDDEEEQDDDTLPEVEPVSDDDDVPEDDDDFLPEDEGQDAGQDPAEDEPERIEEALDVHKGSADYYDAHISFSPLLMSPIGVSKYTL